MKLVGAVRASCDCGWTAEVPGQGLAAHFTLVDVAAHHHAVCPNRKTEPENIMVACPLCGWARGRVPEPGAYASTAKALILRSRIHYLVRHWLDDITTEANH